MSPPRFFLRQETALVTARDLISRLPPSAVFSVFVTEADSFSDPSILNLFVSSDEEQKKLVELLELGEPVDEDDAFTSYQRGPVMVSIIQEPRFLAMQPKGEKP